jgi:uncharacterized damage-inducible protein DinB
MMKRMVVMLALVACCVTGTKAQMGATAPKAAPGAVVEPSKTFDALLSIYEGGMMGAVKAMPADKYSFAPSQAIFKPEQVTQFDTVRTFAQEVTHVTQANYFFYGAASGLKPEVDVKAIGDLTDKDQIVAALQASFVFGHKAIATLTTNNAFEAVKGFPDSTRASMVAFGIAHGFDHYGQLVEYLRTNGIVPPASEKK